VKLEQFELPGSILKVKLTGPLDIKGANEIDIIEPVVKPIGQAAGGIQKGTESVGRAVRRALPF
jgi:hypothetical protein